MNQTIMQGTSRRTFRYKSCGDNELTDCRAGLSRGLRFFEPRSPFRVKRYRSLAVELIAKSAVAPKLTWFRCSRRILLVSL
jgi:hypothetical protein